MSSLIFAFVLGVCDLGEIFSRADAWQQSSEQFVRAHEADGFRAADASGTQITAMGVGKCTYFNLPIMESRVYFRDDVVSRVEMSLYNRGDAAKFANGEKMSSDEIKELLSSIAKKIDSEKKPPRAERRENRSGGVQLTRRWDAATPPAELTWGVASDKTVDFVRLVLRTKKDAKKPAIVKSTSGVQAAKKAKANLQKNDAGDVWISNVPMVDQGAKGYCAAATAERVLRYYGHTVDEHQIAQMAETTAEGGTSCSDMIETVKVLGSNYRLGFNQMYARGDTIADLKREVEAYNKVAKDKIFLRIPIKFRDFQEGNIVRVSALREAMERDVMFEMRIRDSNYKKFLKEIKMRIDQGVPVFWGVTLGIFPEDDAPQARGGHMRLIIGYNFKTREILYTDSWGAGHELKRMKEDRAFVITHDAFTLRPL